MSLLFRIVYAAHANGTHHKLALDALNSLECANAEGWRRLFLANATLYLKGSKDPDNEFKDFKNHVLHVRDGYWGGAGEKTESWYAQLVTELSAGRWPQAVYTAGVLSHYFCDPIHPFHTGQSEAENNVHRAVEWSINRSYDSLRKIGESNFAALDPRPGEGHSWLREFLVRGAEAANRYYEPLMAHYNLDKGVADPPSGLDSVGRGFIAELIVLASRSFARVLERAIADAKATPPDVDLRLDTLLAALKIPVKFVTNKLEDAADRREVERMYAELKTTGRVDETLGAAERTIRTLKAAEVEPALAEARKAARAAFLERKTEAAPHAEIVEAPRPQAPARTYLAIGDEIERAPSIGPKMAERLSALGIARVSDLLAAAPAELSERLDDRRIDAATIADWQDQSRLMIEVPGLRGGHAQLLVGAGFRTHAALAEADAQELCAKVLAFAATPEGRRILRDGDPPDVARIKGWLDSAKLAKAA